jgi:hypothetical protein
MPYAFLISCPSFQLLPVPPVFGYIPSTLYQALTGDSDIYFRAGFLVEATAALFFNKLYGLEVHKQRGTTA